MTFMNPSAKAAGLELGAFGRRDRTHEGAPTDIHSGVVVGCRFIAARLAEKVVPVLSVGLIAVSALRACTRGVAGIYCPENDSGEPSLILDKATQLVKPPLAMPR